MATLRRLFTTSVGASAAAFMSYKWSAAEGVKGTSCGGTPAPKCKPLILCGPSGAGKSTLIGMLMKEFPGQFGFSVSHTTRGPRPGEDDGVHYHFVDKAVMEKEIADGKFLETAHVHGNIYGTSFRAVDSVSEKNLICILDIDVQGVKTCRGMTFDGTYIFVAPPSIESLRHRLVKRGTETEEKINKRVDAASWELGEAKAMPWDEYIVNDDLEAAYAKLKAAIHVSREECNAARSALK